MSTEGIMVDLSIIIVNWKSSSWVRGCLASIHANAAALRCEVIVVDNASYDGCEEMVKAEFPGVVFLQAGHNLGFAGANNVALAKCQGRNVLFLNPDTEIQGKALQALASAIESLPTAGLVGARLLNSDFSLQTTCVTALPSILNQALGSAHLRRAFPKWGIWGMRPLFEAREKPVCVEAISGACIMARRQVIESVGGFNTEYFMYSEDMDLCATVRDNGWDIYYVPEARIVHHAGGSSVSRQESNFSSIMLRESVARFMRLHRGPGYANLYRSSTAAIAVFRIVLLLVASPLAVYPHAYCVLSRAFKKWWGIFFWSLGLTPWVSRASKLEIGRRRKVADRLASQTE